MVPNLAAHRRTAFSSTISNTGVSSPSDELMIFRTSEAAESCSSASSRSRASCANSGPWPAAAELRGRAASVPLTRFGVAGVPRRDLADPALERPRMAFPEAQEAHGSGSNWPVGSGLPMSALGQKRTLGHVRAMSALPPKADIGTQPRDVRFVPKGDIPVLFDHLVS